MEKKHFLWALLCCVIFYLMFMFLVFELEDTIVPFPFSYGYVIEEPVLINNSLILYGGIDNEKYQKKA